MRLKGKSYWSGWVLLSVFVPMVLLSSLHVHSEWNYMSETTCHECLAHAVHNGHIDALKAHVDCPLCAFQSNVYQGEENISPSHYQSAVELEEECQVPAIATGDISIKQTRAPPASFCA